MREMFLNETLNGAKFFGARAHRMRTCEPRQGRKAATVVCSASAVVALACDGFVGSSIRANVAVAKESQKANPKRLMAYLVIARKYRPQRFEDVVGQDHVTRTLINAIQQNRLAHAYLFCGPRGTGKTTIARIFAKCLNCTNGPRVDFDDNDPRCKEIAEGRSLDVLEIDGASNRGIEEVRELRETVKYAPATSRFKIYIIDEVHMLTKEAFNALLKTLEEPPAHVKFMFATTEPEKVLPTIMSRCQRFDLRRIPTALIVKRLRRIAELENVEVDDAALFAIARGADGALRDAESALDQLISFCGGRVQEQDVLSMFGLTAQSQIIELARAIIGGDVQDALLRLDQLAMAGKDLGRLLTDLLNHFRNLLVHKISPAALDPNELSELEVSALKQQAETIDTEAVRRVLEVLTEAEARYRDVVSKKIFFEVTLLKAVEARNAVSLDSVLRQLAQLRSEAGQLSPTGSGAKAGARGAGSDSSGFVQSAAPQVQPAKWPPTHTGELQATASRGEAVRLSESLSDLWAKLLEAVGLVSPVTASCFLEAHPVSFTGTELTVGFDPAQENYIDLADSLRSRTLLESKLGELGYPSVRVKIVKAPAPEGWAALKRQLAQRLEKLDSKESKRAVKKFESGRISIDEFKNDPLIRKALEIFRGQIINAES